MSKFSTRSTQKELLDRDDIPFEDIRQNMKELDFINKWLGGHMITIDGIHSLLPNNPNTQVTILEIGCGGGDNLRVIKEWCSKKRMSVKLIGVDINPHCIGFAQSRKENADIEFICSDYKQLQLANKPDIIFSSLFCHHFTNEELAKQLEWMKENTTVGFFMNDLQRHRLAYYSIEALTALFSKSYLVKNDAPLSVLRGFKRNELLQILKQSSIINYQLNWKWAFRWLLVFHH